jgi:hypothetical protein
MGSCCVPSCTGQRLVLIETLFVFFSVLSGESQRRGEGFLGSTSLPLPFESLFLSFVT